MVTMSEFKKMIVKEGFTGSVDITISFNADEFVKSSLDDWELGPADVYENNQVYVALKKKV